MRYFSILIALALLVGAARAQLAMTGAGKTGTGIAPAGCTGTIDLSEGCPQPMLGL